VSAESGEIALTRGSEFLQIVHSRTCIYDEYFRACNCDADLDSWTADSGDITQMEHLPVKQLKFGDTGTPLDDKEGTFTLGPLACQGDSKLNFWLLVDSTFILSYFFQTCSTMS
jgi:hypothetical protein